MRAAAGVDLDVEPVAADQAARRMSQHVVANRIAFGVETLQNAQRALMPKARDAALGLKAVVELKSGVPRHGAKGPTVPRG